METNWFVFTGAPSSGKTTLLYQLEKHGFTIVQDEGRIYFHELKNTGSLNRALQEERIHQLKIIERKLKKNASFSPHKVLLFDYGLPCSIVWGERLGISFPNAIVEAANSFRYKSIFLFERLNLFKDEIRIEDEKACLEIEEQLYKKYSLQSYRIFKVDKFNGIFEKSIECRKNFVIDKVSHELSSLSLLQ